MKLNLIRESYRKEEGDEPVTLAEVKLYSVIDESNTDDDELLESLIPAARKFVENKTGASLVSGTVTARILNQLGGIELPYYPIATVTLKDEEDATISTALYKIVGSERKSLKTVFDCEVTATYDVGFEEVPGYLKQAVLERVDYLYKNRGEIK